MAFKPLLVNKATGQPASLAKHHEIGNVLANKTNPLGSALGRKILRNLPPQAASGNAASVGVMKPGNNTNGVFLTATRQEKDVINDARTEPRNVMDWKPL